MATEADKGHRAVLFARARCSWSPAPSFAASLRHDPGGRGGDGIATAAQAGRGPKTDDPALPPGLFRYVWQEGRAQQVWLCLLAAGVFPLTMVPLELQRRIIDQAIGNEDLRLLAVLGAVYLGVVLAQGALKYLLRFSRGVASERAIRRLRRRMQASQP
ncbi:MAG TPA: hypothetical protein VLE23_15280, partial [Geminicoccaceae bacterium]|nr:hypothetical protein [Geminicoccaceae bacterium]